MQLLPLYLPFYAVPFSLYTAQQQIHTPCRTLYPYPESAQTSRFRPLVAHEGVLDLLFGAHDGFGYDVLADGVGVYIAHYQHGQKVLHERISGVASSEAHQFSGSLLWGLTVEGGVPNEIRAIVTMNTASGRGHFDFTQLYFPSALTMIRLFDASGPIELGEQYILHMWLSGHIARFGDAFDLDLIINENDEAIVLYMIFH